MKKLLINQPAGIGDILFIQKIVKHFQCEYKVYLPVKDSISWMCNYMDTVCTMDSISDVKFDRVLNLDGCSNTLSGSRIMEAKYSVAGLDFENYIDYVDIKRNRQREDELFGNKIDIGKPYRLVCPWYGTPNKSMGGMLKMDIPISRDIQNVVMNIDSTYTLFDWIKIITEADEIYTTDSAIMFLIEKFDCKAKTLVAYSRRSNEKEVDYLFSKNWRYEVGV